jgi:lysophospholipase L1-like esterase
MTGSDRAFLASVLTLCVTIAILVDAHRTSKEELRALNELRVVLAKNTENIRLLSPANLGSDRIATRVVMIRSQLAQAEAPIVIAGDSLTEAALLPSSICGHPVVNAGIGGISVSPYLPLAEDFLSNREVPLVVVELGTNDSTKVSPRGESFVSAYRSVAEFFAQHSAQQLFVGLPPVDVTGALASQYFDGPLMDQHDIAIRALAKERGVDFVDVRSGMAATGMTVDGIHLNKNGYKIWTSSVVRGIEKQIGCAPTIARRSQSQATVIDGRLTEGNEPH